MRKLYSTMPTTMRHWYACVSYIAPGNLICECMHSSWSDTALKRFRRLGISSNSIFSLLQNELNARIKLATFDISIYKQVIKNI